MTAGRPSAVRSVAAITWANLVRLSRDRLGLFFIVVLPLLIILLFGVATAATQRAAPVGIVASGSGELGDDLVSRVATQETLQVRRFDTQEALRTAVRRRIVTAGLVVPEDYDAQLRQGSTSTVTLLVDPRGSVPTAIRATLVGTVAAENVRVQTAQFADDELAVDFAEGLALADDTGEDGDVVVDVETAGAATQDARPVDRSAAANLVLFVFITSLVGSAALIESRRLGVSRRMLAAPTTAGTVLAGEATGRFAVALLQGLIVIVGASLLFGAQWQNPAAVWVVVALLSLAGTGAAMLLGATFGNAEQASGVAVPLGIGLGMLGGCMWPLEIVPPVMQTIGHATPHAWAMDALTQVLQGGVGFGDIALELAVLAGFALVLLALAAAQLRRILQSGATA